MIPETPAEAIARRQKSGFRYKCMYCGRDLPGSNRESKQISRGSCVPICQAAIDLGSGATFKIYDEDD